MCSGSGFTRFAMSQSAQQQAFKEPIKWLDNTIGSLAVTIVLVFFSTWLFQYIWNTVLYEKIEGIDSVSFWEAFAILLLPLCFFARPLFLL